MSVSYPETVVCVSTTADTSRSYRAKRDAFRFRHGDTVYRLDPSATDPIEATDDPARAYNNVPTHDRLPGFGDRGDDCGKQMKHFCGGCGQVACDEHGDHVEIGQTCWKKSCPRCGNGWAMRAAYTATAKIEAMRQQEYHERGESPRFHHVVVSAPDFAVSKEDADDAFFDLVKNVLDATAINCSGGLIVHHSHSGEQGDDRGVWKDRLFNDRDWEGDVQDELSVRHHAHVIALADHVDHKLCQQIYDKTGILTHRIEDENHVSLFDTEDLASATTYALSHARVADDADSYRYFGRVANFSADAQTEARMKREVRSVAPQTLDLSLGELTCDREITENEESATEHFSGEGGGGGSDTTDDTLTSSTSPNARCGGPLVPIQFAPSYLDGDRDLKYEDELRATYDAWDPPD
jgi:hypothetical protein